MQTTQDIDRMMRRTQRYWYEDGINDLGMGSFLFVLGLYFIILVLTPQDSPLWSIWSTSGPFVVIGAGLAAGWMMKQMKARLTWPRTGQVDYERKGMSQTARMIALCLVAGLVAAVAVLISRNLMNMMTFFGFVFFAVFCFVGYRFMLLRYFLLASWGLALGLALAWLPLSLEQASAVFYSGTGLGMLVSGAITWHRYDATAPRPQEPTDGSAG
jgi:MFS family permease